MLCKSLIALALAFGVLASPVPGELDKKSGRALSPLIGSLQVIRPPVVYNPTQTYAAIIDVSIQLEIDVNNILTQIDQCDPEDDEKVDELLQKLLWIIQDAKRKCDMVPQNNIPNEKDAIKHKLEIIFKHYTNSCSKFGSKTHAVDIAFHDLFASLGWFIGDLLNIVENLLGGLLGGHCTSC